MRGALKSIICISTIVCAPPGVEAQDAPQSAGPSVSLEAGFETASQQVQNQLLNAPDASYVYLNHWVDIYNQSKNEGPVFSFERQSWVSHIPTRDYSNPIKPTDWRPNGFPIVSPDWRYSVPVSFRLASRFRPDPPPKVSSAAFKQDVEDVRVYGDKYSLYRTPEESLSSAFWANGPGTETPPGRWNVIALESSKAFPRAQRVELMLKLNIALYDAGIAAFDAKYHYAYWRPQTAIQKLDVETADWEPMMEPPFHPEYVSGHSAFSGAGAAVLEHYLGITAFCITAPELLDLEQCYESFTDAAEAAGRSRIFGGIHFEFSNQAGLKLGRDVAAHVISNINLSEN